MNIKIAHVNKKKKKFLNKKSINFALKTSTDTRTIKLNQNETVLLHYIYINSSVYTISHQGYESRSIKRRTEESC